MNKKTGQIIIAFIIGLLSLWLSQTAMAQGPNPYCFDVTITDGQVSVTEPITWTYIGGGYTTAFSDSNYITDDNGNGNNGGGIEFYNALPADETITISGTVKHQHTSCGVVIWGVNDGGWETTWGSQNTYSEGSNCGGPYISPVITHTGYNGVDKDFSIWNEYGADRIYSGTFQVTWPGCSVYTPGGGSDCATVTDADFAVGTPYSAGGWSVGALGVTIHGSYLDIPPLDVVPGEGNTWQEFTPEYRTYTATMYARSANTNTTSVDIAILDANWDGAYTPVTVTQTVNQNFGIYTFTLTNSLTAGDEAYLFVQTGIEGVQIDYLCLEPNAGVCASPSEREYVYITDPNNWEAGLNLWTPLEIDSALSIPELVEFQSFLAPDGVDGGYQQSVVNSGLSAFDVIGSIISLFKISVDSLDTIESIYTEGSLLNSIALKMPGKALLESISIDVGRLYQVYGLDLIVLALVDDEWQTVGNSTTIYQSSGGDILDIETITINLQPVSKPTEYAIISTVAFNPLAVFSQLYITKIATYGCYSGDGYTGACVVSDPSLDGGENGGPDDYYWYWTPDAPVVPGGVSLSAENNSTLSQHVFTPNPGAYQLSVTLINDTSDRCELYARGAAETGYEQDDFFNVLLPCVTSVASQTVTADVLLPDDQFEFILTANRGHATVTDICFSLPGGQCLNKNSLFTDGTTGYDGSFTVENGHIILNPMTQIYAIPEPQEPFYTGNGPWILEIEATSAVTGETVLSAITPGLNPVDTTITANHYAQISTTQTITYAITKTDDEQRALILTGNGPSVYNNDADSRLWLTKYCLMTDTGTTWWWNKDCTTMTNPDFLNGLTGWTAISAVGLGGWAILDTNGSVRQTVSFDNLITNPGFEVDISGWSESDSGSCIIRGQDTSQSKIGSASLKIAKTCDTAAYVYTEASALTNTPYTFGAWIKTTGKYKIRLRQTDGTTYASDVQTGSGSWEFKSISTVASSGTGALRASWFFDATTAGNADYYIDGAVLVAGSTIPVQYETPQDATVHWIAKSGISSEITATVSVSSTAGVFSTTQVVGPAMEEFFTPFNVGGDVEVRVAGTTAGLELDFVCLNSGTYTGGGPEGGWTPGVGDGRCSPPPMVVMTNTLTAWLPSIWIWSAQPNNYELVGAYSAAWLRFIGCTLVDLQKMLEVKLNVIIEKLGATSNGGWADALARIFEAIANMIASIAGVISQLLTLLITIWNSLAPGLGLVWQLMGTLLELLDMIISLLADFAGWLLQMMMTLAQIAMNFILDSATVPGEMLTAYNNAINDPAYDIIPLSAVPTGEMGMQSIDLDCTVPESNYWCGILFGFQIVNQSIGASILYPMVIIGLILSTIFVFRNQLWEYYNFKIK